ncbi:hypothetical protein LG634_10300 [Streptomyces bambusae]|uniref:hypothetical protein n=1 Tax=Streptomyces bambusae TaxID=1550616 RepID=UPI001CFD7A50|nr:hypothetical protein [Streptomyces bambusae]MCB5165218.1 hypothetical protein [Streptomyces bambusae]
MAHTARPVHTTARLRRTLDREVPGTVGLLTDPADFAAMTAYDTFPFHDPADHDAYLHAVHGLLHARTARGRHTDVALFDPEDYLDFCTHHTLDPDTPEARTRFTAGLAATGTAVPFEGQPLDTLVPLLVDESVRQTTWEYATLLLAGLGPCADCGTDIGHSAFTRADRILDRLLDGAGPGDHHLVVSVPADADQLVAALHSGAPPRTRAEFVTVLAAGLGLQRTGGLVLRRSTEGAPDRLHGWRLDHGALLPISAAEVFNAYCTDADTGDLLAPEPGVEYCPGYPVDEPDPHH